MNNVNAEEQVEINMCGFDGVRRGSYFGGELVKSTEGEVRVKKLKIDKAAGKDEGTGEMIKIQVELEVECVCRFYGLGNGI